MMTRRSWQCEDSSTGAHHWVNVTGTRVWICQYCGDDTDQFIMGIDEKRVRYGYMPYSQPDYAASVRHIVRVGVDVAEKE